MITLCFNIRFLFKNRIKKREREVRREEDREEQKKGKRMKG